MQAWSFVSAQFHLSDLASSTHGIGPLRSMSDGAKTFKAGAHFTLLASLDSFESGGVGKSLKASRWAMLEAVSIGVGAEVMPNL